MVNFASALDFQASRRPDKVVVIDGDVRRTTTELAARVNALAAALVDRGVGRGDVVGILLYNRVEFLEVVHAVNRVGAVFLPLNYRLAPAEWAYILDHGRVRMLVTEEEFAARVDDVRGDLPELRHVVSVDGRGRDGWLHYADDLVSPQAGVVTEAVDLEPEDLSRLMYTSGTTSRPKGVCISHGNVAWKNAALLAEFGWTSEEVVLVAGPLYHVGAFDMGGVTTLHAGGTVVLQGRFVATEVLRGIAEHRATTIWLAPAMVNAVLQSPALPGADLSSLRLMLSGGEKMPVARLEQLLDAMPDLWFADAYGLTETVSSDTFNDRAHMRTKIGSVGRPVLYQAVRIVDEAGADVGVGELGEIALRGPKVFGAYWRDPEATAAAIRDGWFHTGDVGRLDEDGFLYIEDRKKDMIVSGGENIATPEIERVLYEHPAIVEAAVIGMPDERWGEVPQAFVALRPGAEVAADELVAFCAQRLAKFKVPRSVILVEELPRTPSGKVLKRELRNGEVAR